jgi:hypothetical protein
MRASGLQVKFDPNGQLSELDVTPVWQGSDPPKLGHEEYKSLREKLDRMKPIGLTMTSNSQLWCSSECHSFESYETACVEVAWSRIRPRDGGFFLSELSIRYTAPENQYLRPAKNNTRQSNPPQK